MSSGKESLFLALLHVSCCPAGLVQLYQIIELLRVFHLPELSLVRHFNL
jgi:hypothetical protein